MTLSEQQVQKMIDQSMNKKIGKMFDGPVIKFDRPIRYDPKIRGGDTSRQFFPGSVNSTATAGFPYFAPQGWTITSPANGQYVVTHNMNITDESYYVVATVTDTTSKVAAISAKTANDFTVVTFDSSSDVQFPSMFDFIVAV